VSTCITKQHMCTTCAPRVMCDGNCGDLCRMVAELLAEPNGHELWHRAEARDRKRRAPALTDTQETPK